MSIDRQLLRPLGILSALAALPILEAGLLAASAFVREGDSVRTVLSSLGGLGGFLLLGAGVLLFLKRHVGRGIALWGSAASIVAHVIGALIGLVGGHGVLYGVGFPVAIVLLLRGTPSSGVPIAARNADTPSPASRDRNDELLSAAIG
jgi:hypothetical protein